MFKLTIVTPEKRLVLNQEIEEVTLPAFKGELNVLPGHAPMITTLETGVLKWKLKGQEAQKTAAISWGYCQVSVEGVNILADIAKLPEEIDLASTEELVKNSETKLGGETLNDVEWNQVQRELALARASIEALPATKKVH